MLKDVESIWKRKQEDVESIWTSIPISSAEKAKLIPLGRPSSINAGCLKIVKLRWINCPYIAVKDGLLSWKRGVAGGGGGE